MPISAYNTTTKQFSEVLLDAADLNAALGDLNASQIALNRLAAGGASTGQVMAYQGGSWGPITLTGSYSLPAATSTVLGGVKQGAGITIAVDGTASVNLTSYVQKAASPTAGHYAVLTSDGSIADGGDAVTTVNNLLDYVIGGGYAGTPAASQRGILHVLPHPITLPAGLTGSVATALTAATSAAVFTLAYVRSGSSTTIATLTFTGTAGVFSSVTIPTLQAGDVITLTAPGTPDATLADIGISILGTKQ